MSIFSTILGWQSFGAGGGVRRLLVECPRVCVIDNSPSILETIPIVLGGTYGVECFTADEYLRDPSQLGSADLLIVADDVLPTESLTSLLHGPPILWLQTRRGPPPVT